MVPAYGNVSGRCRRGMASTIRAGGVRLCDNIKSRANPDVQCVFSASHGNYCSRHYKNPRPFKKKMTETEQPTRYNPRQQKALKRIQSFWRRRAPYMRFRSQGPAVNARDLAVNDTELYSMENVNTIPSLYFISFSDARKGIWIFDIRTLVHSMATGYPSQNPYTRTEFTERAKGIIHRRIEWLRSRKYQILHTNTDVLTPEQAWKQIVLDIFLKIEALGYYVSCEWFHDMNASAHTVFYKKLFDLWTWRLGLTRAQQEEIVPGHASGAQRLFRIDVSDTLEKSKVWWQKKNISIIEAFITRAQDKEKQKMGALYVLMALVQVSPPAAQALPWIVP